MKFEGQERPLPPRKSVQGGTQPAVQGLVTDQRVVISCPSLFGGTQPIKNFLEHVNKVSEHDEITHIFRPDYNVLDWDAGVPLPKRSLNAVSLDTDLKGDLVRNVETFLKSASYRWYANRGIPYRRGMLFYGHPGTGKTSFANALAGHLRLGVFMVLLSTPSLTDNLLYDLFILLPEPGVVLFKDIDSVGIQRECIQTESAKPQTETENVRTPTAHTKYDS